MIARLQRLAASAGTSVSSAAIHELSEASRRADNPRLLGELPDLAVVGEEIVAEIDAVRSSR
ncbi:MAG: antitoxin [Candidatus Dormibacteria bacterium]